MITFYKADETDFDNNGLGVLDHDIQNPDIEEKLNDIFTFSFNYPIFGVNGSRLAARMIVKADDPENEGQLFRIMKLSKSNGMLTAFCYHIFYDLNGNEIPDTNIVGQNGQTAITQMLSKTAVAHKFQGYSDISDIANIRVVRMSPVKFLIDPQTDNNFINRLGGEIRRVNYRIWMNKIRGSDNGATIRWKKSLDSYNATWDYTTIATRIRPVGYNGIMLPESYVDSPLIDKYETISIKEIQYSDIKAIDPNATSNDETAVPLEEAYELLRQAASKEFSGNNLDKPTVTLSVNMVALRNMDEYKDVKSLETINPWDTVTVINERDGLSVKVRLNHYHWNPVTRKFISMELGNSKSTFTDIGSKVDHATNLANQANDTANTAAESANGKNSNYYGPSEPSRPVDGDLWYKKNGDKTELWQYDGKSVPPGWKLVVDDATGEEVRQNVDAAQKEAEEAKKQANESVAAANDAVAQAGFATDTATQAKSDAAAAQTDAANALGQANTAIANAANAINAATDAQTKTNSLVTKVDDIAGTIKALATTETVDQLAGTVAATQSLAQFAADGLKLKADMTTVNQINGTVNNLKGELDVQADKIAATVTANDVTGMLNGYATQSWSQGILSAAKNEITASVQNMTSDMATQTWTQGKLNLTASGLTSQISSVQTNLDSLSFGYRNLIPNGSFNDGLNGWTVSLQPGEAINAISLAGNETLNGNHFIFMDGNNSASTTYVGDIASTKTIPLEPSTEYSLRIITRSMVTNYLSFFEEKDKNGNVINNHAFMVNQTDASKYSENIQHFTTSATANYGNFRLRIYPGDQFVAGEIFLVQGNRLPKDWISAPEDQATVAQFTSIEQTLKGVQVTANNAVTQSQHTQLADQVTSVVSSLNSPNLVDEDGWTAGNGGVIEQQSHAFYTGTHVLYRLVNTTASEVFAYPKNTMKLKPNTKYTLKFIGFASSNVTGMDVWILGKSSDGKTSQNIMVVNNRKLSPTEAEVVTATFTTGNVTTNGQLRFDNNGSSSAPADASLYFAEVQIVEGTTAGVYQTAESQVQSQITQLKNDINLRVQKGDVVNQINISPESILIDGKKVHITGQTTIDNAVIKDAMIADIKADKITAGTINGANVNVINLNANNITTGTLKGANLSMNLNTGEVVFQKGAIRSTNGNLNIDISKGTMAVINQYKSGFYFEDGKLVLNDGWLEGTSNQPKYGSLEYNANFFTVNGLAVKGTEGVTIGTPGYNPLAMFTSVNESGIAIDKKHLEIGSVGPTIISSGNRFFMNLLTQSPFIAVGTTADGSYMTTSDPGSRISLYAEYVHIKSAYSKTASGSANLIVTQDGALVRSTSASKYKTDIIRANATDYGEKLLELPTATWVDIAETKRYRDDPVNQPKPTRNYGMIAEDLADAGLEMLVVRGADGELEGINYDRIGPALIPVIAKLKNEVEILKQKLEEKTA